LGLYETGEEGNKMMKVKPVIVVLFILSIAGFNASAASKADTVRAGYRDSLTYLLNHIDKVNNVEKITYIISVTEEEALIYFSSDYSKDLSPKLSRLHKKILSLCLSGNQAVFLKYLYLSQFVDGYFAEDYFIDIEKIAKANRKVFCAVLAKTNAAKVKRLKEVKAKYCK
jgi:hypothetical protein